MKILDWGKHKNYYIMFGILLYLLIALSPMLSSGYYSDDISNSLIRSKLQFSNTSFLRYLSEEIGSWIRYNGRLFPVAALSGGLVYYIADNLILYKVTLLSLVIIDTILFYLVLAEFFRNKSLAVFAAILAPIFFQYRMYHDPILAFGGLLQLFFLLFLLSILFLLFFNKENKWIYLALSTVLFNSLLYMYEIGFVLFPFYMLVLLQNNKGIRKNTIYLVPFGLSLIAGLTANIVVRSIFLEIGSGYQGNTISLKTFEIIKTLFVQIFSAVPLSYFFGNPSHLFSANVKDIIRQISLIDIATGFLFSFLYISIFSNKNRIENKCGKYIFPFGLYLWLSPAVLIAVSTKYQKELIQYGLGMAYLPVYIEYFGLILVVAYMLLRTINCLEGRRVFARTVMYSILVVVEILLLINMQNNRLVIEKMNDDLFYRRAILEKGLQAGLCFDIPEMSNILIIDSYGANPNDGIRDDNNAWINTYSWKNEYLIYKYSNKKYRVYTDIRKFVEDTELTDENLIVDNCYIVIIRSFPPKFKIKNGYLLSGRIKSVNIKWDNIEKSLFSVVEWSYYSDSTVNDIIEISRENMYEDGIWTNGKGIINLYFNIADSRKYFILRTFGYNPFLYDMTASKLKVYINNRRLVYYKTEGLSIYFKLPPGIKTVNQIVIESPTFIPKDIGMNDDVRSLGIDIADYLFY